jgi:hypothetical protein
LPFLYEQDLSTGSGSAQEDQNHLVEISGKKFKVSHREMFQLLVINSLGTNEKRKILAQKYN